MKLDDKLLISLREARRHHLQGWLASFQEHRKHPGFQVLSLPLSLEYGFTCPCSGTEEDPYELRISITNLREMLPRARDAWFRVFKHYANVGGRKLKKERHKADEKARCLLMRHLTRPQKWTMRATRQFDVVGQDGRTYEVSLGYGSNVEVVAEGVRYKLCVVPMRQGLPIYDLLLAQKVLLETDTAKFLWTAIVLDTTTGTTYQNGAFLAGEGPPKVLRLAVRRVAGEPRVVMQRLEVSNGVLENPQEWIREQVGET